jgi:DNA-binding MarR family transcriptional regulator
MKTQRRTTTKSLGQVMLTLEEMRKLNTSMTVNVALVFLLVAAEPGITAMDIQKRLNMGSSAATRVVAALQETHRHGSEGLNLVRFKPDLFDRRVKHLYLTPQGERVWTSVKRILEIEA